MTERKKINHWLHFVLTVATLGLWLPVWWVVCMVYMPRDIGHGVEDIRDAFRAQREKEAQAARAGRVSREDAIARGWDPDLLEEDDER